MKLWKEQLAQQSGQEGTVTPEQYQMQMAAWTQLMQAQAAQNASSADSAANNNTAVQLAGPDLMPSASTEAAGVDQSAYLSAAAGAQQQMATIEQYAEAVARNGIQFEAMAQKKHATDPSFSWLVDGGQYHDYYKARVNHYKEVYGKS